MEQYISKAAVAEEIEGRLKVLYKDRDFNYLQIKELEALLSFLDTIVVKEEILDKEGKTKLMKKCVHKAYKRGYDMGVLKTTNEMNHNMKDVDLEKEFEWFLDEVEGVPRMWHSDEQIEWAKDIAKHFYELGLAQKGE
jgi:hypothetical protein